MMQADTCTQEGFTFSQQYKDVCAHASFCLLYQQITLQGSCLPPCFFLVPNHYLLGHRHHSLVLEAILLLVWYYISQWHVTHIFDSTTFTFFSLPQLQSYQKVKNTDWKLPTYSLFLILNQLLLLQIKRQGKEVIQFSNSLDIVQVSYLHISRNSCIIVLRSF